ncbi:MAG: TlpA disulfide reductase family protein [Xanthobacteraceae bacterium]|nr:TlpA disulfide reductase family protein [Xanthobacteraceae bacterium]
MTVQPPDVSLKPSGRAQMLRLMLAAALLGAVAGLAAVYGIGGLIRNGTSAETDPACGGAVEAGRRLTSLARGEVAALALAATPRRVPDLVFRDGEGKSVRLADFRGRTVLLNLWATWCVPCRKEMPALDALERALGGRNFTVVAINLDTRDPEKPRRFLAEVGVNSLRYFEDPSTGVFQELKRVGRAVGLPTSLIVDPQGCELGVIAGPAEWGSEDALALVRAAIGG